jgi:hypothetical protein
VRSLISVGFATSTRRVDLGYVAAGGEPTAETQCVLGRLAGRA